MSSNIYREARRMHNDIVIVHDHRLGRLIGFHEDIMDYYYTVRHMNGVVDRDDNIVRYSCVGPCVSLRGIDRYEHVERMHSMNGAPPSEKFLYTSQRKEYQNEWYFTPDTSA